MLLEECSEAPLLSTALGNTMWLCDFLRPYLEKAYTLSPPDPDTDQDLASSPQFPGNGLIQVTYTALKEKGNHDLIRAGNETFQEKGYEYTGEFIAHESACTHAYTAAIDPISGKRSSANSQYATALSGRANVTIEYWRPGRLSNLGILVLIGNPNVGENLQNRLMSIVAIPLSTGKAKNVAFGILVLAFARLIEQDQESLLVKHGPFDQQQEKVISSIFQSPGHASAAFLFSKATSDLTITGVIPSYPFSRGNIHISSADPNAQPTLDPRFFTHELDIEITARHVQTLHQLPSSPALKPYFQLTASPGDLETIKESLRKNSLR
ncbi:uncharacterized protein BDW43DRAFT_306748 [Aspergillus alliaceus]|uniref:uncharacterized protein n=1 Tax=Petromyces alliaceus TaxID=209559 RepID=UPI0012A45A12|nr:uncharacterized protein BDW43DRAFT_306748 [Aspergillus alliaceus]KAB8238048.1 hypothetical protein BDW43DRAFT_306748 [Aspergillus alliaceus]